MSDESFKTSLSVQAETLLMLDEKMTKLRAMAESLCSQLGMVTQEYYVLNEAMRETVRELNGGQPPLIVKHQSFPQLNHYG